MELQTKSLNNHAETTANNVDRGGNGDQVDGPHHDVGELEAPVNPVVADEREQAGGSDDRPSGVDEPQSPIDAMADARREPQYPGHGHGRSNDAPEAPSTTPPVSSDAAPTWAASLEWIDPGSLKNHAVWQDALGFESAESEAELTAYVREHKVSQPMIVTGDRCASGPNVILDGHRFRRAAIDARLGVVPIIRRTDLTADAEEILIIKSALLSQHVRRLKPSQLAALERRLFDLYAKGRGFRSDLTSVGANGRAQGDTLDLVAKDGGQTRNAVADRKKIFFSPVSSSSVQKAVDKGTLSPSAAAAIVRKIEKEPGVARVLRGTTSETADNPTLVSARETVEQMVREHVGNSKSAKKLKKKKPLKPTEVLSELLRRSPTDLSADITLDSTVWRVTVRGATISHLKIDKVEPSAKPSPAIVETDVAQSPLLTIPRSVQIAREVVDRLPDDLLADIKVSDVTLEDWCRCLRCGSTRFWRDRALRYRCRPCHWQDVDLGEDFGLSLEEQARRRLRRDLAMMQEREAWSRELGMQERQRWNTRWPEFLASRWPSWARRFHVLDSVDLRCPRFAQSITVRPVTATRAKTIHLRWWNARDRYPREREGNVLVEMIGPSCIRHLVTVSPTVPVRGDLTN